MTAQSKATIKSYFETGDRPTQAQFANLVDSYLDTFEIHFASDVVPDLIQLQDINITNGQKVPSSSSYQFKAADAGATVALQNSTGSIILNTTIATVVGGVATLADAWAGTTIASHTGIMTFYHTDNTAAIQNALDTIVATHADANGHNMTGFKLLLPDGGIAVSSIDQPRLSMIEFQGGPQSGFLFCISGTNDSVLKSENVDALFGSGLNYGPSNPQVPSWFGVKNMHIDGNKAGNSAGNCISYYGNAQMFQGLCLFRNTKDYNMHTEAANLPPYNSTDWRAQEEGFFENVICRNAGNYGWLNRGPHDSVVMSYIGAVNGSYGYRSEVSGSLYSGANHVVIMHTYANGGGLGQYWGASSTIGETETDFDNITIASNCHFSKIENLQAGFGGVNTLIATAGAAFTTIGTHRINFVSGAVGITGVDIQAGVAGPFMIGESMAAQAAGAGNITFIKNRNNFTTIGNMIVANAAAGSSIGLDHQGDFCNYKATGFFNDIGILWGGGGQNVLYWQQFQGTAVLSGTPSGSNIIVIQSDLAGQSMGMFPSLTVAATVSASAFVGPLKGVTVSSNAAVGFVGEYQSSVIVAASAVPLTTATTKTVTFLPLQAGDYDVWGHILFAPASATSTVQLVAAINSAQDMLPLAPSGGYTQWIGEVSGASVPTLTTPAVRRVMAASANVYLNAFTQFNNSTNAAYGTLHARRRR